MRLTTTFSYTQAINALRIFYYVTDSKHRSYKGFRAVNHARKVVINHYFGSS